MSRRRAVVVLLMLALVGASCDSGAEPVAAGLPDPCRLVTRAEAARFLNTTVDAGRSSVERPGFLPPVGVAGMVFCGFQSTDGARGLEVGATTPGLSDRFARAQLGQVRTDPFLTGVVPVRGVGKEAVWAPGISGLVVLATRQIVFVQVRMEARDLGQRERAVRLAREVLKRL